MQIRRGNIISSYVNCVLCDHSSAKNFDKVVAPSANVYVSFLEKI